MTRTFLKKDGRNGQPGNVWKWARPTGWQFAGSTIQLSRKEAWHTERHYRDVHVCETSLPFPMVEIIFRYFKPKFWSCLFFLFSGSTAFLTRSGGWESSPLHSGLEQRGRGRPDSILGRWSKTLGLWGWKSSVFENKREAHSIRAAWGLISSPPSTTAAFKFQEEVFSVWPLVSMCWLNEFQQRDRNPLLVVACASLSAFGNLICRGLRSAWGVYSR